MLTLPLTHTPLITGYFVNLEILVAHTIFLPNVAIGKLAKHTDRVMAEKRTIHEKPVSSQYPDEHQHDREGEGQELSQSETPTAAKGNPVVRQIIVTLVQITQLYNKKI